MVPNSSQNHIKAFMALCQEFETWMVYYELLENAMCRKSLEDWKWNKKIHRPIFKSAKKRRDKRAVTWLTLVPDTSRLYS